MKNPACPTEMLSSLGEIAVLSAMVNTYIEVSRIYQDGLTFAPLALQMPALDDKICPLPEEYRH